MGYRQGGRVITTGLTTDGIIDGTGPLADFETFHFGPEWNGLTRVEIPTPLWSLDNLVVAIPEPSSTALLALGAGMLVVARRRKVAAPPAGPCLPSTWAPKASPEPYLCSRKPRMHTNQQVPDTAASTPESLTF